MGEMRKTVVISLAIILIQFLIGVYFYPVMPERMASHWGLGGNADGYQPKTIALYMIPIVSLGMFGLFLVLPRADPLKNIMRFREYYDGFVLLFLTFMLYIDSIVISWNLGIRFNMNQVLAPGFGALFYGIGIVSEKAKRNWFVGIRTPWTLSNEEVWEKTHRIGGKLFKMCGICAFLGVFAGAYALLFAVAPIILVSIYLVIYSYSKYQKKNFRSPL